MDSQKTTQKVEHAVVKGSLTVNISKKNFQPTAVGVSQDKGGKKWLKTVLIGPDKSRLRSPQQQLPSSFEAVCFWVTLT